LIVIIKTAPAYGVYISQLYVTLEFAFFLIRLFTKSHIIFKKVFQKISKHCCVQMMILIITFWFRV